MSPTEAAGSRPKLLLVDDDAISREVLSMLFEMHGYPVACAEDGTEAIASVASELPEVILMDTQMPGISGLDLIRELRIRTRSKILAISGSEVSAAIREAADGFLLKPIKPEDLDALLAADSETPSEATPATPAIPETAGAPVIDPQVLGKLRKMMPAGAVREIYEAVAADLATRLKHLAAAMEAGNAAEVARIAHTTKGGCSMVGLTEATEAAARLESDSLDPGGLKSSNLSGTWSKELAQLHSALSALERILSGEFPT
jgi:CheY-like chemotaxis protein